MSEENIFAAMLREHAHKMDMECAPEESDFWAAADHIYLLERQLYAANSRIEELEQKLRTTSLEALAISDTNNEMAVRIVQSEKTRDEAMALVVEANNSLYGSQGYFHSLNGGAFDKYHLANGIEELKSSSRRTHMAEARLSEAVKVLEGLLDVTESDNTPNDIIRFSRSRIQAFITTLGGET